MAGPRATVAAAATVALLAAGVAGCGGSASDPTVADVGGHQITKAELTHWMRVLKGGQAISDPSAAADATVRTQALQLLISTRWLIDEAARRGIVVTPAEVHDQIDRVMGTSFPGGQPELREFLQSTGQTVADVELRATAQLIAQRLRRTAIETAPAVTAAEVAGYYRRNKASFRIPEERRARFTNRKTKAAAEKLKREVEAGKSLTSPEQREVGELFTGAHEPPTNIYERTIDEAPVDKVSGPYKLHADYWLYEVVKVIPPRQRTLAEVAGQIRAKLERERRQAAVASFDRTLTREWRAKTDCKPGYVMPRCRQYEGTAAEEDPLSVQ